MDSVQSGLINSTALGFTVCRTATWVKSIASLPRYVFMIAHTLGACRHLLKRVPCQIKKAPKKALQYFLKYFQILKTLFLSPLSTFKFLKEVCFICGEGGGCSFFSYQICMRVMLTFTGVDYVDHLHPVKNTGFSPTHSCGVLELLPLSVLSIEMLFRHLHCTSTSGA